MMAHPTAWRSAAFSALCVLLALALRLSTLPYHLSKSMNSDAALFLLEARAEVETGQPRLGPLWPPLYPLASASLGRAAGVDPETAALTLAISGGALLPVPIYFLARAMLGPGAAAFAAICTAALRPLSFWSCQAFGETLFLLTLYGLLWFWQPGSAGAARCLAAGLLCGAAYLLRPEGFLLPGLLALWIALEPGDRPAVRGARVLLLAAGFLFVAAPGLLRLREQVGHWTVSGKAGWNLLVGDNFLSKDYNRLAWSPASDGKELACVRAMRELTLGQVLLERPGELAKRYAVNTARLLVQLTDSLGWLLALLAIAGAATLRSERRALAVVAAACAPLAALPLFFINERFTLLALPALLLLAARGAESVSRFLSRTQTGQRLVWSALLAAALLPHLAIQAAMAGAAPAARSAFRVGEELRIAGEWMREHCPPGSRTTNVWAAYHSRLEPVQLPFAPWKATLQYLRGRGCDYLVVDRRNALEGWLPESSAEFAFLLGPGQPPPGLREAYRWNDRPEFEVRVFEIR